MGVLEPPRFVEAFAAWQLSPLFPRFLGSSLRGGGFSLRLSMKKERLPRAQVGSHQISVLCKALNFLFQGLLKASMYGYPATELETCEVRSLNPKP